MSIEVGSGSHEAMQISEDKQKGEGATAFWCWEAVATCTGERADSRTTPARQQTETRSQGTRVTRLLMELRCAHWNQTENWNSGAHRCSWQLAAGSVETKDRDVPAL